jgi:hypothetical protein
MSYLTICDPNEEPGLVYTEEDGWHLVLKPKASTTTTERGNILESFVALVLKHHGQLLIIPSMLLNPMFVIINVVQMKASDLRTKCADFVCVLFVFLY